MQHTELASLILDAVPQTVRGIRMEMRKSSKDLLTVPQLRVLFRLVKEPQSNQELASWIGVSAATMSATIELLVERGLVRRRASGGDRRRVDLSVTPKGKLLSNKIHLSVQGVYSKKLAVLSLAELNLLEKAMLLLQRIHS